MQNNEASRLIELLEKAQGIIRDELQQQFNDGNNRYKVNCLLDARLNVLRAIEALYDNQQLPPQP